MEKRTPKEWYKKSLEALNELNDEQIKKMLKSLNEINAALKELKKEIEIDLAVKEIDDLIKSNTKEMSCK